MPGTWTRSFGTLDFSATTQEFLGYAATGQTILRIHANVIVTLRLPSETDPATLLDQPFGVGIYTTTDDVSGLITPLATPGDVSPPYERWLWWNALTVVPASPGRADYGGYQVWQAKAEPTPIDVKAPVAGAPSTGTAAMISVETHYALPAGGLMYASYWASVLISAGAA